MFSRRDLENMGTLCIPTRIGPRPDRYEDQSEFKRTSASTESVRVQPEIQRPTNVIYNPRDAFKTAKRHS